MLLPDRELELGEWQVAGGGRGLQGSNFNSRRRPQRIRSRVDELLPGCSDCWGAAWCGS